MKRFLALIALLPLAACYCDKDCERRTGLYSGQVQWVATSPNGVTLWRHYDPEGGTVYFSTHGTSYRVPCGKACTRTVTTPSN